MNQLTERADRERELGITPQYGDALQKLLPDGWQALSLVRIGYPTHIPNKSPRRAVEAVIAHDSDLVFPSRAIASAFPLRRLPLGCERFIGRRRGSH